MAPSTLSVEGVIYGGRKQRLPMRIMGRVSENDIVHPGKHVIDTSMGILVV